MTFILALDNVRSSYNVGALLRSALAFGVTEVHTIGITPHLKQVHDPRLPHVINKAAKEISKTALGGEALLARHFNSNKEFLEWMRSANCDLLCLEMAEQAVPLPDLKSTKNLVLVVGNEVDGVNRDILVTSDMVVQIPTPGEKKSLNVSSAGSIAMYAISQVFAKM